MAQQAGAANIPSAGPSPGSHHRVALPNDGIPFLTVRNITAGNGVSFENTKFIRPSDHAQFTKRAHPRRGDLLISKDGTLGVTRVIETDRPFSIFVSLALVRPRLDRIHPYFLKLFFDSDLAARQFEAKTLGSALQHLHLEEIGDVALPLPPMSEQIDIVTTTSEAAAKLRSVISAVANQAALLREYRSALISAAVTGQLDLRQHENQLEALA